MELRMQYPACSGQDAEDNIIAYLDAALAMTLLAEDELSQDVRDHLAEMSVLAYRCAQALRQDDADPVLADYDRSGLDEVIVAQLQHTSGETWLVPWWVIWGYSTFEECQEQWNHKS
jgi:hypothetical protein